MKINWDTCDTLKMWVQILTPQKRIRGVKICDRNISTLMGKKIFER